MQTHNLVEVYSAGDAIEANVVCDVLAEAGIESQIVGESLQNAMGDLPFTVTGPRVWTAESDATRARIVVQEWVREQWPDSVKTKREPLQFSLKSIFIAVTVVAFLAPILPLIYGWSWIGLFWLLFYSLFAVLAITAYRRKRAWRYKPDEDDVVKTP